MFSNDLNSAYAYEIERRRDEMRDAANSQLERECLGERKSTVIWLKQRVLRPELAVILIITLLLLHFSG